MERHGDGRQSAFKFLPAEDISAEDAADDVAQVGDVVDIRQSAGHKQVSLALLWQTDRKKTEWGFK